MRGCFAAIVVAACLMGGCNSSDTATDRGRTGDGMTRDDVGGTRNGNNSGMGSPTGTSGTGMGSTSGSGSGASGGGSGGGTGNSSGTR